MNDDKIIFGIEDIPAIADSKCGVCKKQLTKENFSDWFIFLEDGGQMYKVPCCDSCMAERYNGGEKTE